MIVAIDFMSIVNIVIAIPVIVTLSVLGWGVGKYITTMLDLRWRKAKYEVEKELKE